MKADGTDEQPLARGSGPVWSPDGSRIAFISSRGGLGQVSVMDADGQNPRQVTAEDYSSISGLIWSPDGSRIAFTREYSSEIFVMEDDGGNQQRLTHNNYTELPWAWSPDGTRIALTERGLSVVDADGGGRSQTIYGDSGLEPAWSPDGTVIAFISRGDVLVVDAVGAGEPAVIHQDFPAERPAWSPDSSRIAFVGHRDGIAEVFVVGADGSNPRQVTSVQSPFVDRPIWSPDGSRIAFVSAGRIFLVDPDDGRQRELAQGEEPAWSPDGSRIAFSHYGDGGYEIAVINADGTNQQVLTHNRHGDHAPDWSPDGSRIAFSSDRDGDGEIFTMKPDGSDVRQLTHNNYNDQNPRWDPGGSDAFADDEGRFYEPALNALEVRGILQRTECGERLACPEDDMRRWVMAVWLVRVLDGADPEPVTSTRFVDVDPGVWWMPFVERVAELGVTKGCAPDPAEYCPEEPVTRAQMATFLIRAFDLWRANTAGFLDTGGNSHEASIDALAGAGITIGCQVNPARFCPHAPVTRGQMATFMARALGLVALPQRVSSSVPRLVFTSSNFSSYPAHRNFSSYPAHRVFLVDADGRNLRQLTSIDSSWYPVWSPDGSQIAYVGQSGRGLFVVDADLNSREQVVEDLWIEDPVWSPDGSRIAFANSHNDWFLYVVDRDGSNLSRLLQFPHHNPTTMLWSPDGSHIAFDTYVDGRSQIFVVDVAEAKFWQVTYNASSSSYFVWTPDGSRIAFNGSSEEVSDGSRVSRQGVYVVDKYGLDLRLLTGSHGGWSPVWSPDGSQVALTQYEDGDADILVGDANGANLRRLTIASTGVWGLAWSRDGRRIAFSSLVEGGWEVFTANVDNAEIRRLTHEKYRTVALPFWSPDDRYISFSYLPSGEGTSGRYTEWEIAVIRMDDGSLVRLTDNQYGDTKPAWSPRVGSGE